MDVHSKCVCFILFFFSFNTDVSYIFIEPHEGNNIVRCHDPFIVVDFEAQCTIFLLLSVFILFDCCLIYTPVNITPNGKSDAGLWTYEFLLGQI